MGGGFVVDYEGLSSFGQRLANLRGEFDAGAEAIGPLLSTISDGGLRAALNGFVTNWSDERAKLDENLSKAAGFASEAAAAYQRGDSVTASMFSGS